MKSKNKYIVDHDLREKERERSLITKHIQASEADLYNILFHSLVNDMFYGV